MLSGYRARGNGRQGITIGAEDGEAVRAAAPGRVVYSGSGLRGYGRLVIVKHNDAFLTAYAYNDALLVEEGASVDAGSPRAVPAAPPRARKASILSSECTATP
ncbi:MAG: peptidoglycan DD-metalloendopeptidase family protein [Arhodomonas sp.]|nr:peptidoglycan DD-metalloendopeptidase family protein [Arhodomonas sp.]